MRTRIVLPLAVACLAAAARSQMLVAGNGQPFALEHGWYVNLATGERTIAFDKAYDGAVGVDDAGGRVFVAPGGTPGLALWTYGSPNPPQVLGTVIDNNPWPHSVEIDGLAYGGGRLMMSSAISIYRGLYEIDPATLLATPLITGGGAYPHSLAFNPADGMFYGYINQQWSNTPGLFRYDLLGTLSVTQITGIPPGSTPEVDGVAIGNGRAYLINDGTYPMAVWDFALPGWVPNFVSTGLVLDGLYAGAEWAPSLPVQGKPWIYCNGKKNAQSCVPYLDWIGDASASNASAFTVRAAHLRVGAAGLLYYTTAGAASIPFGGGTLCLAQPRHRTVTSISTGDPMSCNGVLTFDFNAHIASGVDPALVAGQTVWMQFVSRDPGFAAPNNFGLSPALRAVIKP